MPDYDSCKKQHKVGIKLISPFVEKLLKIKKKVCGSGPKSAQKKCVVMPNSLCNSINQEYLCLYSPTLPRGAMGWSVKCDSGISSSLLLVTTLKVYHKTRIKCKENSKQWRNKK